MANTFFNEMSEQSQVKTAIVSKYFWAWAKVIMSAVRKHPNGRIAYIDLFAGPGRYNDGTRSTPLLILEQAIKDTDMRNMLVTVFNDKEQAYAMSLEQAIMALPGIDTLKYKPSISSYEVGEDIIKSLETTKIIPTLFFVDPWGYKGLSLRLVNSVLKDWGCDCIFFFNYNRINMGLSNPVVEAHMNALFGDDAAKKIRPILETLNPEERELTIVEKIVEALIQMGGKFVLPFGFKNQSGARTTHHLFFVSKNFRGYEIMKGIMAKESSSKEQNVPSFEYNPADSRYPKLFDLTSKFEDLENMLLNDFAGQTLSMEETYLKHNIGKPYIKSNYKEMLKLLENNGKIVTNPPKSKRRKDTFADSVMVTFPPKG